MSLLKETMEIITSENLQTSKICFVGLPDERYDCSWDKFTEMAKDTNSCMNDLEIHFKEGDKLVRNVSDGGWQYIAPYINGCTASFRELTTLSLHTFSIEKKELIELQRLKAKYES